MFSAAMQFRHSLGKDALLKIYGQFDRTDFSSYEDEDTRRLFALGEDNVYLNATLRRPLKSKASRERPKPTTVGRNANKNCT